MAAEKIATHDGDSDGPLYNVLLIALSFGILIVVGALYFMKADEKSFSELYFEDQASLPNYVDIGTVYPYAFTIHNLEENNRTYQFSVKTEHYMLDYSCEYPDLWADVASDDPALYIKEDTYKLGFDYEMKSGNNISVAIVSPDSKDIIRLFIYNDRLVLGGDEILIPDEPGRHRFVMAADRYHINISIDSREYQFNTPSQYSHGFLNIDTHDTYAEFIAGFIQKPIRYPIYIKLPDSTYEEYKLKNDTGVFYSEDPINLTTYTVKAVFRLKAFSLNLNANSRIISDNNTLTVIYANQTETYDVDTTSLSTIEAKVDNETIRIYFNGRYITRIPNLNETVKPQIAFNNATVSDLSVISDESPLVIKYDVPKGKATTSQLMTPDTLRYITETQNYSPSFTNITSGLEDDEQIREFVEQEKITSDDYRVSVTYVDREGILKIAMADVEKNIYSIEIQKGLAKIEYYNYSLQTSYANVTSYRTNRIYIDVMNDTLAIFVNDRRIFGQKALTTGGMLLFDYENVTITNAQLEDRNSGSMTTYRKQKVACEPILLGEDAKNFTVTIPPKNSGTIQNRIIFKEPFDLAKISVKTDEGQEIYYWVRLM